MNKTFCALAWSHLAVDTSGNVSPCCISSSYICREDGSPYNFGKDTVDEIFNSQAYQDIRNYMLAGNPVKGCEECYHIEKFGGYSNRQSYNDVFTDVDGSITNITYLDIRFGNKCNLACRSCSPVSSSKLQREVEQYTELKDSYQLVSKDISTWYTTDVCENNLDKVIETANAFYLAGGEPSISKQNFDLLYKLVERKRNEEVFILVSTNIMTITPKFYDLLNKFKNLQINISIDGIGKTQEYLRYPSNWHRIEQNLQKIINIENAKLIVNSVIQIPNLEHCVEIFDYFENINKRSGKKLFTLSPIDLVFPEHTNLLYLPTEYKIKCWEQIEDWSTNNNEYNTDLLDKMNSIKTKCYETVDHVTMKTKIAEYLKVNNVFDVNRKTSLTDINPKLAEVLRKIIE